MRNALCAALLVALLGNTALASPPPSDAAAQHGAMMLRARMDFGRPEAADTNLTLMFGHERRSQRAAVPIAVAQYRNGSWQSVRISGMEMRASAEGLNAVDGGTPWVPWAIGGLVGIGAAAIVIRLSANEDQDAFDITGGPNRD